MRRDHRQGRAAHAARGRRRPELPDHLTDQADLAARFLALHVPGEPLLIPNPWDAGSAKVLEALEFKALATTSSGFAATLGRMDGQVTRDEAIAHSAEIAEATSLPVSADLENGFADDPAEVAETVRLAIGAGLAGCSIEDFTGREGDAVYDLELAAERVRAAADAARSGSVRLVLTARADGWLHGRKDVGELIERLQAFQEAGADVLYAPGPADMEDIRRIVESVERPVNVLARHGAPPVAELAAAGVARISVGGGFAFVALGALVEAAEELRDAGTYGFWQKARAAGPAVGRAFS